LSVDHWLWLSAAVAFAAFVQGTTGVGFALLVAPLFGLLAPALLPVGVLLLMLPLNAYVGWRERAALDAVGVGWISVGRALGTAGGLAVLALLSARQLGLFVGVSILAAVAATLLVPRFAPGRRTLIGAGIVTGITETATGIGGPPLALALQHRSPATMRSTIALCFLLGELMSLAVLALSGRVGRADLGASAQLLPALVLGAWLSRHVHTRLDARFMRAFVLMFAAVSAIVLLLRSV
jgi:uncharacterized membrane protein YfcA